MVLPEYTATPALIVAAHPDDAVLGAGAWAASYRGALAVAFLTDGVPRDKRYFAPGFTDPAHYRATRQREARRAWQQLRPDAELHFGTVTDQSLAFQLPAAGVWIDSILAAFRPRRVLVPAFEGGHPDHDAANRLMAAHAAHLEIWEYALYTVWRGAVHYQTFPDRGSLEAPRAERAPAAANRNPPTSDQRERPSEKWRATGAGSSMRASPAAYAAKRRALSAYHSQHATLAAFNPEAEALRPLPRHNYGKPARDEAAVYERWGWPWQARDVAVALAAYAR